MIKASTILALSTLAAVVMAGTTLPGSGALAEDMGALKKEAVTNIKKFGGTLKGELQGAMKAGGPVTAIGVCNEKAPAIAARLSESSGWSLNRTSLKLRNSNNAPDEWELGVLKAFEERKAGGESVAKMAFAEVVERDGEKVYRFMKAIPTEELCLKCHGGAVAPEVTAKLDHLYPGDKARGFKVGDIRGAFTLEKPL